MSDDIDYETTDDGHTMREEDEKVWGVFLGVRKQEDSSSEQPLKKSRLETPDANLGTEQNGIASQVLGASTDTAALFAKDSESNETVLSGEEEAVTQPCVLMDLLSRSPSDRTNEEIVSLRLRDLCSQCELCRIMRKVRVRPSFQESITTLPETRREESLQFWACLDRFANTLYWPASQVDGDTTYPLTQQLNKDAILDHPFMRKCNSKFKIASYAKPEDIPHISEPGKVLNPIQAEELRLNKALICTASHYSDLAYTSRATSKLEALDLCENVIKSLRILWFAELGCRKAALEDAQS